VLCVVEFVIGAVGMCHATVHEHASHTRCAHSFRMHTRPDITRSLRRDRHGIVVHKHVASGQCRKLTLSAVVGIAVACCVVPLDGLGTHGHFVFVSSRGIDDTFGFTIEVGLPELVGLMQHTHIYIYIEHSL
jgi:hypothetical protein